MVDTLVNYIAFINCLFFYIWCLWKLDEHIENKIEMIYYEAEMKRLIEEAIQTNEQKL